MLDRRTFAQVLLAGMLAPIALVGCGSSGGNESAENEPAEEPEAMTGMANPFVDCESAYEAAQLAGFEVTFPESVPGYSERHYQAIEGKMVQCFYSEGDERVLIRKGVDDGSGDLSGDYGEYPETSAVTVGDSEVTLRGAEGLVHVAIWGRDGYLFAIDADAGLEPDVIQNLVAATL